MRSMRYALGSTVLAASFALAGCGDGDAECDLVPPVAQGEGGSAGTADDGGGAGGETDETPTAGSGGASDATAGAAGMPESMAGAAGDAATAGAAGTPDSPILAEDLHPVFLQWQGSAHADAEAEAFTHWNEDDPAEVPTSCAQCHSGTGLQDFLGADGSDAGVVDAAQPVGSVIDCQTCHNAATDMLSSVTFPSGVEVTGLGSEALCMTCHQGRASGATVEMGILAAAAPDGTAEEDITPDNPDIVVDDDMVYDDLGFTNIHYYAAGATLFAGKVGGGYQYAGQTYDWRFRHASGYDTCTDCHNPHTLEVKVDECADCHTDVETTEDLRGVRMIASMGRDYDGDGDLDEGIAGEIEGLHAQLLSTIQALASEQDAAVCYSSASYPYFFGDTDDDGECSEEEAVYGNRYASWTPRLLRAAYNYQLAAKDPGAFAHNAKYIIQLLHDSLVDVNGALETPANLDNLVRNDPGHFNGAGEAARHWDEDEGVSASCSACHGGAEGFHFYLEYGVGKTVEEQDNGLDCETCHSSLAPDYDVYTVDEVTFPSGATVDGLGADGLCTVCHAGRSSGASIKATFANGGTTRFMNVHYLAGGATRLGTATQVGYEYDGRTYAGVWTGHLNGDACVDCHVPGETNHSFSAVDAFEAESCSPCHGNPNDDEVFTIRASARLTVDYDGDGDSTEPLAGELQGLFDRALADLQGLAMAEAGESICLADRYPYWFVDVADGDGNMNQICGEEDTESFSGWTEPIMAVAHNLQLIRTEPGAWAHNFDYAGQLLYDSIEDMAIRQTGLPADDPDLEATLAYFMVNFDTGAPLQRPGN